MRKTVRDTAKPAIDHRRRGCGGERPAGFIADQDLHTLEQCARAAAGLAVERNQRQLASASL